jgi:transposase
MDQLAWHHAHTEAFRRLGGVPAVLRIDNLKTGVGTGAGPWGAVNDAYRSYANGLGFHVDACLPRCPEDKGKVENKVGVHQASAALCGAYEVWRCRPTATSNSTAGTRRHLPGHRKSRADAWLEEQSSLRRLPILPEVFDVVATRVVQRDCGSV